MTWLRPTIGELCETTTQRDPSMRPDEEFAYIDISSLDKDSKTIVRPSRLLGNDAPSRARKEIKAEDILVSTVRPNLNAVALVPPELDGQIASTGFCVLRARKQVVLPKYCFYWALTETFVNFLVSRSRGASYPAVTDNVVLSCPIPLPPPAEQRRIVHILDQADRLRRKRIDLDAISERISPVLFIRMFGDPGTNPMGWAVREFGDLIKDGPQNGLYKPASEYGSGTPILRIDSFYDGEIATNRVLKRVQLSHSEISNYALRPNDVVINRVNSPEFLGKSALIANLNETTVFESNMMRLSLDTKSISPLYIIHLLQTPAARAFLLRRSKRAVNQASINQQDVCALPVPIPPPEVQWKFEQRCKVIESVVLKQRAFGEAVGDVFKLLLHQAFSGALTARWRDSRVKDLLAELEMQAHVLGLNERAHFAPS
jgi:type I restriction enzyme S subunit